MMPKSSEKTGRMEATMLICDIRGFTALVDERDPVEALAFVNSVLGELGSVVEACSGTIDKFTGDGFLAYFGSSSSIKRNAIEACWCAIRMRDALVKINNQRYVSDQPIVSIGIGIHSGTVALGRISAFKKSELTILGSAVNIASRVESLTKHFGVDCLISSDTADEVSTAFLLQQMPTLPLRGIARVIGTSWLLPMNTWNEEQI